MVITSSKFLKSSGMDELEEVIDAVRSKVVEANRMGYLEDLLHKLELNEFIVSEAKYEPYKSGKILVIGEAEVKEKVLLGVVKELGIDKNRFEFCLDYSKAQKFEYSKLSYNPSYRVVMFGPIPHSSTGKLDSSSVIAEMETKDGYPKVIRLTAGNSLKITKSGFKRAISELLAEDFI